MSLGPYYLPQTLTGYWPFDEGTGTTAYDASGNGNSLAMVNPQAPNWAAGLYGSAFDRSFYKTYLSTGSAAGLPTGPSARSVTMWLNLQSALTDPQILFQAGTGSSTGTIFKVVLNTDATLTFSGFSDDVTSTLKIPTAQSLWTFLAVVYDGGTGITFAVDSQTQSASIASQLSTTNDNQLIAFQNSGGTHTTSYLADDLRYYGRALLAADLSNLLNGSPLPFSLGLMDMGSRVFVRSGF